MIASLSLTAIRKLEALGGMRSGDGVNDYLLSVADHLRHEVASPEEAKSVIRPYLAQARRERSGFDVERELNRQIETAYSGFIKGVVLTNDFKPKPKQPAIDQAAIERIASSGAGVYDLWEQSPVRWDDDQSHTEEVIDGLFSDNEYLSVGMNEWQISHDRRSNLRGRLNNYSFIVPAVMHMEGGTTQEGRHSYRCIKAVKSRPFIVVEFDKIADKDRQAALILHLSEFLPLALVVDSAGKSLHGWFYCEGLAEDDALLLRFIRYAVSLSADPAAFRRCQYVRMPDGTRRPENKRQAVIYWSGGVR